MCVLGCVVITWPSAQAQSTGFFFRYLPAQQVLSSNVELTEVEVGPLIDGRELLARGPGGWGFTAPLSAEFEAPGSKIRSTDSVAFNQVLGPNLTFEAWVRSDVDAQTATLVGNQVSAGDGFTLGLSGGVPFIVLKKGTQYRVDGNEVVPTGENQWIAGTLEYSGGELRLSLFVNGREVGVSTFTPALSGPYAIEVPFLVGTAAEGSRMSPTFLGDFTGHIFAATVRSYVANDLYLNSLVPFDGGPYFGLPDYHDYPSDVFALPMDVRIFPESVQVSTRIFLPYANDEYISQGTGTRVEEGVLGTTKLVYVSYYHRLRNGMTRNLRSIVVEMNSETGRVRRVFRLMGELGFAHVGGVALFQNAFFVSSENTLEKYVLPTYDGPLGPRYYDLTPDADGTIYVQSKASFVSAFRDTLWVGDYRTSSQSKPYLYAHALDSSGRPESVASRVFAIPWRIQGVDFYENENETHVFMSRNRNSTEAELLRFRLNQLESVNVITPDTTIQMPYGIEDLSFFPDGTLWTNSESGTDYYQRRSINPWRPFYPFVYSVEGSELFQNFTATQVTSFPETGNGFQFENFPNPFRGATTLRIFVDVPQHVRISIFDVLGRRISDVTNTRLHPGVHEFPWRASRTSGGLFFVMIEAQQSVSTFPIILTN